MIALWQYTVLGGVALIFLALTLYRDRRSRIRASAFFQRLETRVAHALATQRFVLASKTYKPQSFGHRSWTFDGPLSAVYLFWDGKERQLMVELHTPGSPTPVRKPIRTFSLDFYGHADHDGVLDALLDAISGAVLGYANSTPTRE